MPGGYLVGDSHANGGIKIKTPEGQIEAEGGEVIINKRALSLEDKYVCEGTPKEMTSKINEMEGGVSWSKTGSCRLVSKAEDGTEIGENFTEDSGGNYINTLGYELIDNFDGTYQVLDPDGMDISGQYETLEEAMQTVKEHMENSNMDSHFSDDEKAALGSYIFGDRSKAELNREDVKSKIALMDKEYSEVRKDYKFGFITKDEYFELKKEIVDKYAVYINAAERLNIIINQGISFGVKKDGNNPPTEQASSGSILRSSNPEKRPSPSVSATIYPAGYTMEGNDGNTWEISLDSRGIHRWKRVRADNGVFIDQRDNTKYFVDKNSKGEWTVFSENEGQWSYRDEFPFMNGFETEEDAILIAQGMAGLRGEFAENGKKVEERQPMFVYNYGFTYYDHNKDTINYYYTFYKGENAICDIYFDVYYGAEEDFDYRRDWDAAKESVYDTKYSFTEMKTNGFEIIDYFEVDSGVTEGLLVELSPVDKAIALKEITAIYEDKVARQKEANLIRAITLTKDEKYKILASKNLAANGKQISKCDCGCGVAKDGAEVSSCGCSHSKYKDGGMVDYYKDKQSGEIVTEQEMLNMVDEDDQLDSFYLIGSFISKDEALKNTKYKTGGGVGNEFYVGQSIMLDDKLPHFRRLTKDIQRLVRPYYNVELVIEEIINDKPYNYAKAFVRSNGEKVPFEIKLNEKYIQKYANGGGILSRIEAAEAERLANRENELKKIEAIQPLIDEIYNKDKSAYGLDPDQDTDVFVINFKSKDGNNYALLFRYIKMNQYVTGTGPFNRKNLDSDDIEERLSFGQVELYKVDSTLDFMDIKNVEEIYSSNHPIADTAFTPIFDKIAGEIIDLKEDDLRIAMEIESAEYNSDYANGGGIKKGKELWFSPSGELKTEKKGTAKHYIEQHLAKRFGAESMELVGEDEKDYIYELNGNPMMIAAKTAILEEENGLDIESYGRKKRVHIPKSGIDQTSVHLRYPLITPFKDGGGVGIDSQIEELEAKIDILNNKLLDISMGVVDRREKPKVENQMLILSSKINELLKKKYGWKMTNGGGLDTDDFEMDNSTYTIRMWDTDMDKLNGVAPLMMSYKIKSQALDLANRFYYENDYGVIEVEDENGNRVLTLDAYAANGKSISMNVDKCERCHQPTNNKTTMSMFNEDVICMSCKEKERQNPNYSKAHAADIEQIKKGNYNYSGIGYLPDNYSEHAIMMDGEIYTGDSYYNIVSDQGPNFFNRDESERGYVDNMGEFYDEEIGRESLAADGKPIQEADYLTNAMLSVLDLKNYLDSHNDQIIINGSKYNYFSHAQYNLRVTGGQGAIYNIVPYFPESTVEQLQNGKFYTLLRKDRSHNFAISTTGLVLDIAEDGMDVA